MFTPSNKFFSSSTFYTFALFTGLSFFVLVAYHASSIMHFVASPMTLFSILLPAVALVLAASVIVAKHPVHSLLSLICVFMITVILYLSARAEFLALIFLVVYVGAIAILFLFVIMLLNVKELTSAPRQKLKFIQFVALCSTTPLSLIGAYRLVSAIELFFQENDNFAFLTEPTSLTALVDFVNFQFTDVRMFSTLLYTHHSALFMLVALLLLTAMLGAIVLASSAVDSSETIEFK